MIETEIKIYEDIFEKRIYFSLRLPFFWIPFGPATDFNKREFFQNAP